MLGDTVLTFDGLGTIAAGETLALTHTGGSYTLRFLGDYAGNAAFSQLIGATTIDGVGVTYSFDGTYTNVSAVPEPATWASLGLGLALLGWRLRRRPAPA